MTTRLACIKNLFKIYIAVFAVVLLVLIIINFQNGQSSLLNNSSITYSLLRNKVSNFEVALDETTASTTTKPTLPPLQNVNTTPNNKKDVIESVSQSTTPLICKNLPSHNEPKTKQEELCDSEYGCGLLRQWKQNSLVMCEQNESHQNSQLTCYKHNNHHLPTATFPHTICDSKNLVMDLSKLIKAPCLKYRPGYFCKKETYYNYESGALIGNCKRTKKFSDLEHFSRDFGKDIFSSFVTLEEKKINAQDVKFIDGITIFVSREQDEHVNMFHAMSDFFATHTVIEMLQLNSSNIQIVILDEHFDGPFDFLWNEALSLKRPMRKASSFAKGMVRFERAIFQHAGYATHFLSDLMRFNENDKTMCHSKVPLVANFASRILNGLGIEKRIIGRGELIRVLFISRRPYVKFGVEHSFMSRQISNEEEVLNEIKKHKGYGSKFIVERVDFAHLKLVEQIQKVYNSDFLIGYHGAGLTHSLWLPEDSSAVLEIWNTKTSRGWRCFEQLTFWKGNDYSLWSNSDPRKLVKDSLGDYLTVDVDDFYKTFERMINKMISSRN